MPYYGAWMTHPSHPKDMRIAGGSEQHCARILAERLEMYPDETGYVRQISDEERGL